VHEMKEEVESLHVDLLTNDSSNLDTKPDLSNPVDTS
jgi:hypothetical protein